MTEAQYTKSITKLLKHGIYSWKINAAFAKGVPDLWLSGPAADLWVEVKYLQAIPKTGRITPNLSRLQLKWLLARHKEGRNVAVLVGTPHGSFIIKDPVSWSNGFITNEHNVLTKPEVASELERLLFLGVHNNEPQVKQSICQTAN